MSRPRTLVEVRDLVPQLARENTWGYSRILGELRKLGIKLSKQTVKVILKEYGIDPTSSRGEGSWDDLLSRHSQPLWQCDFLSTPIAEGQESASPSACSVFVLDEAVAEVDRAVQLPSLDAAGSIESEVRCGSASLSEEYVAHC